MTQGEAQKSAISQTRSKKCGCSSCLTVGKLKHMKHEKDSVKRLHLVEAGCDWK